MTKMGHVDLDVVCQHNSCSWYLCNNCMVTSILARVQVCVHFRRVSHVVLCKSLDNQTEALATEMEGTTDSPPQVPKLFIFM